MKRPNEKSGSLRPKRRSRLRLLCGRAYYTGRRYLWWIFGGQRFAKVRPAEEFGHIYASHQTPLYRKLKDVDMELQRNKVTNLKLAVARLDGILLLPGETLSYWKRIGRPSARKGYVEGMVLNCGRYRRGVGGGLCQLSNLLYWMTLHTPLTVVERYRHSYDVFPDSNRTQPFGSGATCVYNYRDLILRNDTAEPFLLRLRVGAEKLEGEWRTRSAPLYRYEVYERGHRLELEPWGGYSRHNEIWRKKYRASGEFLDDEYITENHALMMYEPFLKEASGEGGESG